MHAITSITSISNEQTMDDSHRVNVHTIIVIIYEQAMTVEW